MNAAGQRRLTPWLLALLLVLGGLWLALLAGLGDAPRWNAPTVVGPVAAAPHDAPLPPPLPREQFAVVWQQPLFNPERKPLTPAAGNASLGELELTGVILTPTLHMALLRDRQGGQPLRLRNGEALPGGRLTLVEVKPRAAVFDTPGGRVELTLPAGTPIDAAPAASPDAGAPDATLPDDAPIAPAATDPAAARAAPDNPSQRIRALRQIIQKRRAEQAAALRQGDH